MVYYQFIGTVNEIMKVERGKKIMIKRVTARVECMLDWLTYTHSYSLADFNKSVAELKLTINNAVMVDIITEEEADELLNMIDLKCGKYLK